MPMAALTKKKVKTNSCIVLRLDYSPFSLPQTTINNSAQVLPIMSAFIMQRLSGSEK